MNAVSGRRKAECTRLVRLNVTYSNSRDWVHRRSPRFGITLIELLLVLVLLVVITSLAVPLLHGSFSTVRLRRGTDQVLAAWTNARNKALETGQVFQFRFIPETGQYRVEPWGESWNESSDVDVDVEAAAENQLLVPIEKVLPDEIVFVDGQQKVDDPTSSSRVESLREGTSGDWSAPIRFFPDGTTTYASVLLRNQNKLHQRATLRALTGVGRSSDLLTEEELAALR